MLPKVSIMKRDDYLLVEVTDAVTRVEQILDYGGQFRDAARECGFRRVLLDYRKTRFELDYHSQMELGDHAYDQDFQLEGLRLAALVGPGDAERHRPFETIAGNRCFSYRVFTDEAAALDWLRNP